MNIPIGCNTFMITASTGKRLHTVPMYIVMADLGGSLAHLYGDGWYACILGSNGRGFMCGGNVAVPKPPEEVRDLLERVARVLNHEIHHGGHWVTVWHNHEVSAVWRDGDGDTRFEVSFGVSWVDLKKWSPLDLVEKAAESHVRWWELQQALDIKPHETYRRALGERRPTRH